MRKADVIAELERRIDADARHQHVVDTGSMWRVSALKDFRNWLESQPEPEASALVKEAREWVKDFGNGPRTGELIDRLADALESAESRLNVAREKVRVMRECLKWYADEEIYKQVNLGKGMCVLPTVVGDRGARARTALGATDERG